MRKSMWMLKSETWCRMSKLHNLPKTTNKNMNNKSNVTHSNNKNLLMWRLRSRKCQTEWKPSSKNLNKKINKTNLKAFLSYKSYKKLNFH